MHLLASSPSVLCDLSHVQFFFKFYLLAISLLCHPLLPPTVPKIQEFGVLGYLVKLPTLNLP
jgi:hypothetical protein